MDDATAILEDLVTWWESGDADEDLIMLGRLVNRARELLQPGETRKPERL